MRRDLLVAVVIVITAAVVLSIGLYVLVSTVHPVAPTTPFTPQWKAQLEPGLSYLRPVMGPTTPLNDAMGTLWIINAAKEGIIQMNASATALGFNNNPFTAGNDSLRLDLTRDFGVTGRPLEAVYYIVPGRDWPINGTTGPPVRNGALAFFAGQDFVVADPFNRSVAYTYHLPFAPIWTGQDPASAGDMLIAPRQHVVAIGLAVFPVGPYQYFYASDGAHTVVFETDYVHAGYCPCPVTTGRIAFSLNATLTAHPFVYYNDLQVTSADQFRSGPGQGFLFPLANHTLEVVNVSGRVRAWVPLTLGGLPASVVGDIGFVQASWPTLLFVPVRSAASTGFFALDLRDLSSAFEYTAGGGTLQPVGAPLSRNGVSVFGTWYDPGQNRTRLVAMNATGSTIPQFAPSLPGPAPSVFYVMETQQMFVETAAGQVVTLSTAFGASSNVTPNPFSVDLPSDRPVILYAGSPGGTRYGTLLASSELLGAWTDSATATTVLFRLVPPPYQTIAGTGGRAAALGPGLPTMVLAGVVLESGGFTSGRRTSCSATACGPRSSGRRTRA